MIIKQMLPLRATGMCVVNITRLHVNYSRLSLKSIFSKITYFKRKNINYGTNYRTKELNYEQTN